MTRTTPPPAHDVAALFPELAALERTTVRLHPRREIEPPPDASKIGGRIVWPVGEPWPRCFREHLDLRGAGGAAPRVGLRYVPVLQLTRDDVPELPYPDGTDLFQLLWCPHDHADTYSPHPMVFWRVRAEPMEPAEADPVSADVPDYIPRACRVHPERVAEYPDAFELPEAVRASVHAWEKAMGSPTYQYLLSAAPGTKVGGYVSWIQEPVELRCDEGHAMEHLVTIASAEFDGGSWPRWLAREDADAWTAPYRERDAVQNAPGIMLGDMGSLYVFTCVRCADRPLASEFQCS